MTWFSGEEMEAFGAMALQAVGVDPSGARLTSRSLVVADQRGTHSHGLLRLPLYVSAIEEGGINADPEMTWSAQQGAVALLDADAGLGQVAMQLATDRVIRIAGEYGVGAVAVQSSSHYGAAAFWSKQLTNLGLLGIVTSTTGPTVAPYGGSVKVLGTNPLTMASPGRNNEELVADLATSAGAYGKVIAARNAGEEIPSGWAVDPEGNPTTDPELAMLGALAPFGGHKGSAISSAVEAFSSVLGQGTFAFETEDIWSNPSSRMNIGHLIVAIDPDFFSGRNYARQRTTEFVSTIRSSGGRTGQALAPGDPERQSEQEAGSRVDVMPADVEALKTLAEKLRLEFPTPVE
jgi:LDH2 family malate/lactate/ureidoglycolate dehydrogenase